MAPARHLAVDERTLAAREADPVPAETSWLESAPLEISPRLGQSGHDGRKGPASQIVDRTAEKAVLAQLAARDAEKTAEARRRLAMGRRMRLSDLPRLDEDELDILLDLLGAALAGRASPTAVVSTVSTDGTLTITLEPPGGAPPAAVKTALRRLEAPDFWLTITDAWA